MVMRAASVINKGRKDDEGFAACRRRGGKEFTKPVVELGERVMYVLAASVGKNKFDARWMDGVGLWIKLEGGEPIIGTADGVVKARDFRRKPGEGGRCSNDGIEGFNGVPWEPHPGAGGGSEIKSKVRLPAINERITVISEGKDEYAPRRMRITKKELEKFGFAVGRSGCRAASRASPAVGHTEECRRRIM
jgi:hypothetical protein